jgi:hypothetical protein
MAFRLKQGASISNEVRRIVLKQLEAAISELHSVGVHRVMTQSTMHGGVSKKSVQSSGSCGRCSTRSTAPSIAI